MQLAAVLLRPGGFFRDRRDDLNGITGGILILAFGVAVTALSGALVLALSLLVDPDVGATLRSGALVVLSLQFIALLAGALGLAVVIHLGAKLGGGTGRFGATVEITAWGLVPTALAILLAGLATIAIAASVPTDTASAGGLTAAVAPIQTGLSGLLLVGILLAGSIWQAYIWAGGLRAVHGLHPYGAIGLAVVVATLPLVLLL